MTVPTTAWDAYDVYFYRGFAIEAPTEVGWYWRHDDGAEGGPYRSREAAERGVAEDIKARKEANDEAAFEAWQRRTYT